MLTAIAAAAIAISAHAQQFTGYESIGTLGHPTAGTAMEDMNDYRIAVGGSRTVGGQGVPVAWDGTQLINMGLLSGSLSTDYGSILSINNSNQMAGYQTLNSTNRATYWSSLTATVQDITRPNYQEGQSIQIVEDGRVLCWAAYVKNGSREYYIYTPSTNSYSAVPWSTSYTSYLCWNAAGHMSGSNNIGWTNSVDILGGSTYNIGTLGGNAGRYATTRAISKLGAMTGKSDLHSSSSSPPYRAFLWRPFVPNGTTGKLINLGTVQTMSGNDVINSEGKDVNPWGWVVGWETKNYSQSIGFMYREGQGMFDLNSVKPTGFTDSITWANAINTRGDVLVRSPNGYGNTNCTILIAG